MRRANLRGTRPGWAAVALASALVPSPALAYGPGPVWLLVPMGAWLIFSLFILFVGSGAVVAARDTGDSRRKRERALAAKLAIGLTIFGAVLTVIVATQGPASNGFAVVTGVVTFALGTLAFLTVGPRHGPP